MDKVLAQVTILDDGTAYDPGFPIHPGITVDVRAEGGMLYLTYTERERWDPCPTCHGRGWVRGTDG